MPAHRDYSDERIAARKNHSGVHARGGHGGTAAYGPYFTRQPATRGGQAPVAPSAINAGTRTSFTCVTKTAGHRVETSTPRALDTHEIPGIVNDFRRAIANARGRLRSGGAALRARLSAAPVPLTVF